MKLPSVLLAIGFTSTRNLTAPPYTEDSDRTVNEKFALQKDLEDSPFLKEKSDAQIARHVETLSDDIKNDPVEKEKAIKAYTESAEYKTVMDKVNTRNKEKIDGEKAAAREAAMGAYVDKYDADEKKMMEKNYRDIMQIPADQPLDDTQKKDLDFNFKTKMESDEFQNDRKRYCGEMVDSDDQQRKLVMKQENEFEREKKREANFVQSVQDKYSEVADDDFKKKYDTDNKDAFMKKYDTDNDPTR